MKISDLHFPNEQKDYKGRTYSPIKAALLYEGSKEFTEKVKKLIRASKDTDNFVVNFLCTESFKKEGAYTLMLEEYNRGRIWDYLREMFGCKAHEVFVPEGDLLIGNEEFTVEIPYDGDIPYDDGIDKMIYAVLTQKEIYGLPLMNWFTIINGKFNIYTNTAKTEICETLDGCYAIFYYEGLVAFVEWGNSVYSKYRLS